MTTAGDRPRVNQSRSATVGHTTWQTLIPTGLVTLVHHHTGIDVTDPAVMATVATAGAALLATVKTFAQTFMQTRRDLSDELAELKARLEAID